MLTSKKLTAAAAAVLLSICAGAHAAESSYPARDIELVVPYSAGGSVDAMARNFSKELSQILGTSVVINNRDGAGGTIGVGHVATAAADGYTVLFSPSSPLTQAPYLLGKVPYNVADIQPICQIFENPFVIAVRDGSDIDSLQTLMDRAKKSPGTISYGHAGIGSVPHLATASLARAAELELVDIAFRGDAQVLPQVMGGHVDFAAIGASNVAGKNLKVLAVLGKDRLSALSDVPAVSEVGVTNSIVARNGLYVRRDTPDEIKQALAAACKTATQSEPFRAAASSLYQEVRHMDMDAFGTQLEKDHAVNRELIQSLGLLKE